MLEVEDLHTDYYTGRGSVQAVRGVDFVVNSGTATALVGESGSGKSTAALSIMRLINRPIGDVVGGRVLRSEVLQIKTMDYVTMARTMGASGKWVIRRHILPNIVPTLLVLLSLQLGLAIIAEGSLSFLGLGVPAPAASWGGMLDDGRKHLSDGWWMPTMPGIALSLTVLATNLMGDWLRVRSDPATRR